MTVRSGRGLEPRASRGALPSVSAPTDAPRWRAPPATGADDNLYALALADGSLKWAFEAGGNIEGRPAVLSLPGDGNQTVYFGCSDARVYALDAGSGELRWSYEGSGANFMALDDIKIL